MRQVLPLLNFVQYMSGLLLCKTYKPLMWASPAVNNFNCTMILMYTGINRLYRCALSEEIDVRVNKYSNISFVRKSLTHQRLYLYQ